MGRKSVPFPLGTMGNLIPVIFGIEEVFVLSHL
jgi:hypothetical protein